MNRLKVAVVQENLIWENPQKNHQLFEKQIDKLQEADLIVLPEMFNTGFTMQVQKIAQTYAGRSVEWLKKMACKYDVVLIGSMAIEENKQYFNRLFVVFPDANFLTYNKKHLFTMGGERAVYTSGKERLIFTYRAWRICPLICYDLRFPVWSRNQNDYDLLIYVANWPAVRNAVWKTLLKARAIENQTYTVGVNRIGSDGNGLYHQGNSMIISPKGEVIKQMNDLADAALVELNLETQNKFKQKFPAYCDADKFILNGI